MIYNVTLETSPLFNINFSVPEYGPGIIHIALKPEAGEQVTNKLALYLKSACSLNEAIANNILISTRHLGKAREIVEQLRKINFLSEHDYAILISQYVQKVEAIISRAKQKTSNITPMQKETLEFIYDPFIEDIVKNSGEFETVLKMIGAALSEVYDHVPFFKLIAAIKILNNAEITSEKQNSILESNMHVRKLFSGKENLESTFERLAKNKAIPSLQKQREVLLSYILQKLFYRFSKLLPEQKLKAALTCEIFANATLNFGMVAFVSFQNLEQTINALLYSTPALNLKNAMSSTQTMPGGEQGLLIRTLERCSFSKSELEELKSKIKNNILDKLIIDNINASKLSQNEIEVKSESISTLIRLNNSPILNAENSIIALVKELKSLTKNDNGLKTFNDLIDARAYSKALRSACTIKSPKGAQIVETLMKFKDLLKIDVNESIAPKHLTALHHAATNNIATYEILIKNGADDNLKNASGLAARDLCYESIALKKN